VSRVSLVVAVARNGVIGRGGGLPWHLSFDLKRFKAITMGKPVIMGRRTWESLPRKPLVGRRNIVLTRAAGYSAPGAEVAGSVAEALLLCAGEDEVCVIGGGEIYAQFESLADRIYLTEVDLVAEGDTRFFTLNPADWQEIGRENHARGPLDSAAFTLRVLDRIRD
jgi:dihydrofolate reductase